MFFPKTRSPKIDDMQCPKLITQTRVVPFPSLTHSPTSLIMGSLPSTSFIQCLFGYSYRINLKILQESGLAGLSSLYLLRACSNPSTNPSFWAARWRSFFPPSHKIPVGRCLVDKAMLKWVAQSKNPAGLSAQSCRNIQTNPHKELRQWDC